MFKRKSENNYKALSATNKRRSGGWLHTWRYEHRLTKHAWTTLGVLTWCTHRNSTPLRSVSPTAQRVLLGRDRRVVFSFWTASCGIRRQTRGICSCSFGDACARPPVDRRVFGAFMTTSNDGAKLRSRGSYLKVLVDILHIKKKDSNP